MNRGRFQIYAFILVIVFCLCFFQLRNASGLLRQDHAVLVRWFTHSTRSITSKGDGKSLSCNLSASGSILYNLLWKKLSLHDDCIDEFLHSYCRYVEASPYKQCFCGECLSM